MAYIYDLTDTWNAGGTTFNAIKMNVTDSASAAASKLVTLQTNGTEHFSVTKAGVGYFSGNVGIGTASPSSKLTVLNGDIEINAAGLGNTTLSYNGTTANLTVNSSSASLVLGTSSTERMRIDSSGNVGIGTSSPSNKFVVSNAGANGFEFNTTDNVFQTYNRSGAAYVDFNCYSLNHRIFTGTSPTERMRIDSSGNVGIGTSSPAVKLEVASADAITSLRVDTENTGISANNYSEIALADNNAIRTWWRNVRDGSGKTAFGYNNHLAFLSDAGGTPTERMRIDSSGNLLVGKTSAGAAAPGLELANNGAYGGKIDFYRIDNANTQYHAEFRLTNGTTVGTISTTTTATAYNTSSDYRLKDIDGPITNSGAYIDALKPVQGSWKADGSRFIGLLAHEVQEVSETPIATGVKDGEEMQAMDYSAPEIIANLIAEIQSLRARVAQLEGN